MDTETAQALARGEFRADLRSGLDAFRDQLRAEIRGREVALRVEIRTGLAENRRHTDVLFESLRDEIRLVAEGVATLATRLDSFRP